MSISQKHKDEQAALSLVLAHEYLGVDPGMVWDTLKTHLGLNPADHGTHSFRRTKASLIYPQTKNPRAEELLLNHIKLEGTERYLGVEVDDAMVMAEPMEV